MAHHRDNRLTEACVIYRRILAADAAQPDALHLLGVASAQQSRFDEAIELIEAAIAIRDDQALYHSNLGSALRAAGRPDEAIRRYALALRLDPSLDDAKRNLEALCDENRARLVQEIMSLNDAGDEARARVGAEDLCLGLPDWPEAWFVLGVVAMRRERLSEAAAAFRRALVVNPAYAEAHYNLSMALRRSGEHPAALTAIRRYSVLRPGDGRAARVHAGILQALGDWDATHRFLADLALSGEPAEWVHLALFSVLYTVGREGEFLDIPRDGCAFYAANDTLHRYLGFAHRTRGNAAAARRSFQNAVVLSPAMSDTLLQFSRAVEEDGDVEAAIPWAYRAVAADPSHAPAHTRLGELLVGTQRAAAIRGYMEALFRAARDCGWFWKEPHYVVTKIVQTLMRSVDADFIDRVFTEAALAADRTASATAPWLRYFHGMFRHRAMESRAALPLLESARRDIPMVGLMPPLFTVGALDVDEALTASYEREITIRDEMVPDRADAPFVLLAACDARYLDRFGPAFVRTADATAEGPFVLHLHVVEPDDGTVALVERLAGSVRNARLVLSVERFSDRVPPAMRRTYLTCCRFMRLSRLLELYDRPLLVADVDGVFARNPAGILDGLSAAHPIVCGVDPGTLAYHDSIGGGLIGVLPDAAGRAFARCVRDILLHWYARGAMHYSLDQIALRMAYDHFFTTYPGLSARMLRFDNGVFSYGTGAYVQFFYEKNEPDFAERLRRVVSLVEEFTACGDADPEALSRTIRHGVGIGTRAAIGTPAG